MPATKILAKHLIAVAASTAFGATTGTLTTVACLWACYYTLLLAVYLIDKATARNAGHRAVRRVVAEQARNEAVLATYDEIFAEQDTEPSITVVWQDWDGPITVNGRTISHTA